MPSDRCDRLRRQGYLFFDERSSAALKPCLWCKRALIGGDQCYKHQFYGIASHRCAQIAPTLTCNHRCLFCWRAMEHEVNEEEQCAPETILASLTKLQKKALAGYKPSHGVSPERFNEASHPNQVAISLSGEPTLYRELPRLVNLLNRSGCTTFLVSNGTNPDMLERCSPYQTYVSLTAPDRSTYHMIARPCEDYWDRVQESLQVLSSRRSAVRITLVQGINDHDAHHYARMIRDSGATFVEVKGYMYLGYSRNRLTRDHMPAHERVRCFAESVAISAGYRVRDENIPSRVVCLERLG